MFNTLLTLILVYCALLTDILFVIQILILYILFMVLDLICNLHIMLIIYLFYLGKKWPLIMGSGFGLGLAYENCEKDLKEYFTSP